MTPLHFFYFLLQYYVFYLLKHQSRFSIDWIRKEFLPVGNPETAFLYGYVRKGSSVKIHCQHGCLEKLLVFLTLFNEASFPEMWTQIQQENVSLERTKNPGAYVIRIVSRDGSPVNHESVIKMLSVSCG